MMFNRVIFTILSIMSGENVKSEHAIASEKGCCLSTTHGSGSPSRQNITRSETIKPSQHGGWRKVVQEVSIIL
jgi:hypothetical protein